MRAATRYRAWAEIDLSALAHNVQEVRQILAPSTQIMAVVKADAYGHGDVAVCHTLWDLGVRWFAVSNLEEAYAVRNSCPNAEVFILGYTPPQLASYLAEADIIQGVLSADYAKALAENAGLPVRCHIKLDTGMGRIGFRGETAEDYVRQIEPLFSLRNLSIEGIYTHFAVADSEDPDDVAFTDQQEKRILDVYDALAAAGHPLEHVHFMNSAASVTRPNPRATLARAGIVLYGLHPNYPTPVPMDLDPVMTLRSVVSYVKEVEPGTPISYGRTYVAPEKRTIATVTIGYADGYPRLLSNKGTATVHGVACPITGRVCMDQLMLDVTDVPDPVQPGDVVTLFGKPEPGVITADEAAAMCGTIGYELVCGISKRVPRDFIP